MFYVILNPAYDYAVQMITFLYRFGHRAILVFTEPAQYHAWHYRYAGDLAACVADEYALFQCEGIPELAERIVADFDRETIEGIIPWAEFTVEIGAELGEALGLDWNPVEVIRRFRNKFLLKEFLRTHTDIRVNASRVVQDEAEARAFQAEVGSWPIVVKPAAGAGSRNVFFARNMEELIAACTVVFQGGEGDVLLEEYIHGHNEYVVNGITDAEHDILVTDLWCYDKRDSHGQKNLYFNTLKVDRSDPVFLPLVHYAGAVIEALGLRKAPFHMELKWDEEGPCLVEVGARFAGGNQPLLASRLHERSLFELAACHYVANLPLSITDVNYETYDRYHACIVNGVQPYEIPQIRGVYGIEEVTRLPSFFMIGFIPPVGAYLPMTRDVYSKSYEIYLFHEDRAQVLEDAERVREWIRFI